jgi:hypothetical protein
MEAAAFPVPIPAAAFPVVGVVAEVVDLQCHGRAPLPIRRVLPYPDEVVDPSSCRVRRIGLGRDPR